MKIKNKNHYSEEQCELIQDIIHEIEKISRKAKDVFQDTKLTLETRFQALNYMQLQVATFGNLINNTFEYEVRMDDGMLYTQKLYNEVFYYCQNAKLELEKELNKND